MHFIFSKFYYISYAMQKGIIIIINIIIIISIIINIIIIIGIIINIIIIIGIIINIIRFENCIKKFNIFINRV
jgi:hypothetical protein